MGQIFTDIIPKLGCPLMFKNNFFPLHRTKKMTSSSGVFVGLQVLSEQEGEKLWKKLYFRYETEESYLRHNVKIVTSFKCYML